MLPVSRESVRVRFAALNDLLLQEMVNGRNKRCRSVLCQQSDRCPSASDPGRGSSGVASMFTSVMHTNMQVTYNKSSFD